MGSCFDGASGSIYRKEEIRHTRSLTNPQVTITNKRVYWASESGATKLIFGVSAESEGLMKFPKATSSPFGYLILNKVEGENPSGTTRMAEYSS